MKRGPTRKRESADDEDTTQDMQADINWLKNTPKVNQSRDTLLKKMAATNTLRRSLVNKGSAAAEIFKEFPCFRSTPGLVSIDLGNVIFSKFYSSVQNMSYLSLYVLCFWSHFLQFVG